MDINQFSFILLIISILGGMIAYYLNNYNREKRRELEKVCFELSYELEKKEREMERFLERKNMFDEYTASNYFNDSDKKNQNIIYNDELFYQIEKMLEVKLSQFKNPNYNEIQVSTNEEFLNGEISWETKIKYIKSVSAEYSHMIKTPISAIELAVAKLKTDRDDQDSLEKNIQRISANIKNLKERMKSYGSLSNDINDIISTEELEDINIVEGIQKVTELMVLASYKKINVIVESYEEDIFLKKIEFRKLYNVINLIVENAIEEVEDNGIISIYFRKISQMNLEIGVWNDGPKLQNDIKDQIFDKGFSAKNSSGLGLYIAKEILTHEFSGEISATNTQRYGKDGVEFLVKVNIRGSLNE